MKRQKRLRSYYLRRSVCKAKKNRRVKLRAIEGMERSRKRREVVEEKYLATITITR